ncbi:MAG: hypothetical protein RIS47_322 [Bacteroidota bacterium]|jgi:chorismate synthase
MNNFGRIFRLSIFGESHGNGVGVVIDGCPPGLLVNTDNLQAQLDRRKSGAKGTTPRREPDEPKILSGVFNNYTTGAPITVLFENTNTRSKDYDFLQTPRPGHADFTAMHKYGGYQDFRGGGHFSARITLGLVTAGYFARLVIPNVDIQAQLVEAGGSKNIDEAIDQALKSHDSIGGIIECQATGIEIGLGEPYFDSLESVLSHAIFTIPAVKGIEFGSGFEAAKMYGSQHNDKITDTSGTTSTNHAGGINGGISNGNPLIFRLAIKPTSSISVPQETINVVTGQMDTLTVKGRHDACVALRAPVIVEAVTAIVLADFQLIAKALQVANPKQNQ